MSKTTYYSEVVNILDRETGEVYTTETRKKQKISVEQDKFYMTYIDFIAPLYKITNGTTIAILSWMCAHAEFNTGKVLLTAEERANMRADLGIKTDSAISKSIKSLIDNKVISGKSGSYYINPQIFWKGDNGIRDRMLNTREFEISFTIPMTESGRFE